RGKPTIMRRVASIRIVFVLAGGVDWARAAGRAIWKGRRWSLRHQHWNLAAKALNCPPEGSLRHPARRSQFRDACPDLRLEPLDLVANTICT
ncbi:MAG: hypothetical protein Q8Q14_12250, partial [Gemmatimonadales bacterium]|nr:hypothetical protein [Gemmatimonadales bacterium]